ncbi:MAG: pyrimidine 5'-nucleotidase [Rhodocyclaceae bacterium]|nr:pyrimidine 5'-nucleotidase [Rhodocyclaceae bacterium]
MSSRAVWLLDLDNTLHNASAHIFPHINRSMTAYLVRHLAIGPGEADALRLHYWRRYGATLLGLMRHHGTDPGHFLEHTHHFESIEPLMVFDRALRAMLRRLPGRRIVFSNGPRAYVRTVVDAMGIAHLFDELYGIEQMRFHPKPGVQAYRHLLRDHRLNPHDCILVEDSIENLRTAKRLGMKTVLVGSSLRVPPYVDLRIASILKLHRAAAHLLC